MSKLKLIDINGNISEVDFKNTSLLEKKPNKQAMFDSVLAENAGDRQGTHKTKTKAEVRGGGRKPWRQKHTGRARQGSNRSPQWVGGGTVFGPTPKKNYSIKLNKKIRKLAFRSAFTIKFNEENVMLMKKDTKLDKPSTKSIVNMVKKAKLENTSILFVLNDEGDNIIKSCNNVQLFEAKKWNQLSVRDMLKYKKVIFQEDIMSKLEEAFA